MDYKQLCEETISIVKEAGALIKSYYDQLATIQIEEKGSHDFVTEVDKNAEKLLVSKLESLLPEAGFIAEEGTASKKGESYNWIIDPLDGTTNFIHGSFPFAVSVALVKDMEPVVGVVLEISRNECFYAWKDGGAFMDGKAIKSSKKSKLAHSLIATGFPYNNFSRLDEFMSLMDWFMKNSHGLRRLGSAATDIVWVACGRYDGFFEYGLHAWDIAAGVLILEEAGGRSSDFEGGKSYLFGGEIVCSNGANFDEFIDIVGKHMSSDD